MITKKFLRSLCLPVVMVCFLPAGATQALEIPGDWAGTWSGHADLGYTSSSGNSETSHLNAGFGLQYESAPWTHIFELATIQEKEGGDDTSDRLEAEFKTKYALNELSYVFGDLIYERDEFGGVRERTSETIGYGRKLLNTDVHTLEAELGLGARQSELADGSEEEEGIVRLAGHYHRHISESATFDQGLLVEAGDSNTYVESESALKLKINGNLYAKLGYTVKYNDTVPAGVENTDTYTSVNLTYEF
ncbi:MAG: DUF481 domain-containing protein [Salinisphaeraceae bacterium]|nr:DUF481 domain-containing protein [Salinisphaeraceae bacterium]